MKNYNKLYKEIYNECPRDGSVYPSLYNVEAIFDRGEWKEKKYLNKMYVVSYSIGSYEDYYEINIFVTDKIETAISYVAKFNKLLKRLKGKCDKQYEELHWNRCWEIEEVNGCFYKAIETR